MASNKQISSERSRRDSIESTASLWEKIYERTPSTKQDAPFGNDDKNNDSLEEYPTNDDNNDGDQTDSDASPPISTSLSNLNLNDQLKPWEKPTKQDHIIIIITDKTNTDDDNKRLKQDFSRQGLKWKNEEQELRPWHFGLTAIHLNFEQPQTIDIQLLCLSSSIPFWIKLKKEKQQNALQKNIQKQEKQQNPSQKNVQKKATRHKFQPNFDILLHYGAFTDLNQFYYSPRHSFKDQEDPRNKEYPLCLSFLDDQRNGGGYIEWVIENSKIRRKRQLLVTNINYSIIVDSCSEGFDIYICQKCNMNEFEANVKTSDDCNNNNFRNGRSNDPYHSQRRIYSRPSEPSPSNVRGYSRPRAPPSLGHTQNNRRNQRQHSYEQYQQRNYEQYRQRNYEQYQRRGVHGGCYFPTVQFSLRINSSRLTNNDSQDIQNQIQKTLSLFIDFFLAHNITVCYGKINSNVGPTPYLFLQPSTPNFPSLIMKYSWQMLSSVGYRLQLQIDQDFVQKIMKLSEEENNPDELFYRVCVYLSRIFSLKPFVNICDELDHAISESRRKRSDSAYGLISKIEIQEGNEAYIPSVTLTPTTIRIKPLKLCRTNRVLRAQEQFGKALYSFVLVDISDENGRDLQSFHFRDLRSLLLEYLTEGFKMMEDDREYKYLHHSQSQLRERQFWFYHHTAYDKGPSKRNLSFDEAYKWMGTFDTEKNPAKYAARMALCFSTTKASVEVPRNKVHLGKDIEIKVNDGKVLSFTDGCGTMSEALRNDIKHSLGIRNDFSAVQFRYAGVKGVVSVDTRMNDGTCLYIRPSMTKFQSDHQQFEVCKLSAPRPLFLNRQAILLLSYRKISDAAFFTLQQHNHLTLIRALLRNHDAEKLILEKIPSWLLPRDVHDAHIDYIHEPFFRQLLISSCLQSTRDLLHRTRIRIPRNQGRNMMGIVDEYNVLEQDQVFIQYTLLDRDPNDDKQKTEILDNCKVVITKNPCHHPGDVRTFNAVSHPKLKHLKDVIVFSQQGSRPAPHDISGSDLDGDEYLVVWHEHLVPYETENAEPYDYDSNIPTKKYDRLVERNAINDTVLKIAENDYLGRLSNLHLAFADKHGVDDDKGPGNGVLSTIELAGKISQEVDSGKTGYHPLDEDDMKTLNNALENRRPDFMDNANNEPYTSNRILGKLFRSSKRTLPGWNRLLRYHRHLRHLQVRTRDEPEEEEEEAQEGTNNDEETNINLDPSLVDGVDRSHPAYQDCATFANQLASVYRQEMFEILSLYGLSHESDLWCRNSINGLTGELEDTAYTELEQLVDRTRTRFFNEQAIYCETDKCHIDTPVLDLCNTCRKRQRSTVVACYCACYGGEHASEQAPILSLPWLFATSLLQGRLNQKQTQLDGLLSTAMKRALDRLIFDRRRLILRSSTLKLRRSNDSSVREVDVDVTVCAFIEVLQQYLAPKKHSQWSFILGRFIQMIQSGSRLPNQRNRSDQWELVLETHQVDEEDEYTGTLMSIMWEEREDELMHDYFEDILNICFYEGCEINDISFLNVSEDIILLLQKMAINETIF